MLELLEKPKDTKSWDRFLELEIPTRSSEAYRYVLLQELMNKPFHAPKPFTPLFQPEKGTLVFVNGQYNETLSSPPEPLIALPLSKAYKTYGNFLHARQQKLLKEEKDPFAALNGAYSTEGLFIYIPPKCVCETPLKIIHLIDTFQEPTLICPRVHIFVGQGASLTLLFSQNTSSEAAWINSFIDVALEERGQLTFNHLSHQPASIHDFMALRATLKRQSLLKTVSATNGGTTSRQDYVVHLLGEEAEASLQGIWVLKEHRQHHAHVLMNHQALHCTSLQKFKGVLAGHTRSSFEGKIYVDKEAQKTQAYQMNHNLILDERASAYSKPNLEIFADDVKASHGATVGQIDEEHLFYLKSRGISTEMARMMLVRGFIQEVLDSIIDPTMRNEALQLL